MCLLESLVKTKGALNANFFQFAYRIGQFLPEVEYFCFHGNYFGSPQFTVGFD